MSEIRHALRRLLQRPGPTMACVLALALAIGAVAATAGMVSRILVAPLPVNEPDRLVTFHTRSNFGLTDGFMYEDFLRIRESRDTFTGVAGMTMQSIAFTRQAVTRDAQALFVTPNYFQLLGVQLPLGLDFTPADNRPGASVAIIVSDRFWRDELERRADAVGTETRVTGVPATIVGVAPPGFSGTSLALSPDVFIPVRQIARVGTPHNYFSPVTVTARNGYGYSPQSWIELIGRLRPGVGFQAAQARAEALLLAGEPQAPRNGSRRSRPSGPPSQADRS
ncbi:MAG: ABC transporter permease [Vicinamibacteraceae bacterium]